MQAQNDRVQPKPGPAPTVNIGKPQRFTLANGLKVMVVENHKLPSVSFNLKLDNTPYVEGEKKGVDDLTSSLIGNGTQKITKDAFNEEIDFLGASIDFSSGGAYASGLSKYAGRILELMAQGCLSPNFTQVELDKEKEKMIQGLKAGENSVPAVSARVQNFLVFGKNHPSGEYLTEKTINNVTLQDLVQHYNSYFVTQNAYLVVIGDVKFAEVKAKVETEFQTWKKESAPQLSYTDPKNLQYTQINFVDMPNAVQSEITVLNTVNLKMTDANYFATILANQILGGEFNSYLNMNLREKHGWTYGANSGILGNKYVTKFKASAQVRNEVTADAVVEFINEIKRIRKEKVTNEELNNVKAGYVGKFVMQIEKPETVARYALLTETQKLPENFYENFIKSINAVTPDDILKAANQYFLADNLRILVVGKESDVLVGLEKLKIPMFFFDKMGLPTSKKVEKKVSSDVTVKSIIDKYVTAIGGEKLVLAVKTTLTKSTGTVQGMQLEMTSIASTTGKMKVEMKGMGMTMMKQLITDKEAYVEQQGQRQKLEGDMLTGMKSQAHPFPELALAIKTGVTLLPIQAIEGKDTYAVKDGKTTYFFDVVSGLKVAASTQVEAGGQSMTQTISYSDYKAVNGVKFPYKTVMNVGVNLDLVTSEIKINEGVVDADFN